MCINLVKPLTPDPLDSFSYFRQKRPKVGPIYCVLKEYFNSFIEKSKRKEFDVRVSVRKGGITIITTC